MLLVQNQDEIIKQGKLDRKSCYFAALLPSPDAPKNAASTTKFATNIASGGCAGTKVAASRRFSISLFGRPVPY